MGLKYAGNARKNAKNKPGRGLRPGFEDPRRGKDYFRAFMLTEKFASDTQEATALSKASVCF